MKRGKTLQMGTIVTLLTLLLALAAMPLVTSCSSSGSGYSRSSMHYGGYRGYRGYGMRPWGGYGGGVYIDGGDVTGSVAPDFGAPSMDTMDMGGFDF